jgi:ABC-type branched-subunit amino acid transport system substrate-binding protein
MKPSTLNNMVRKNRNEKTSLDSSNRRRLLKLVGAAGVSAFAGCGGDGDGDGGDGDGDGGDGDGDGGDGDGDGGDGDGDGDGGGDTATPTMAPQEKYDPIGNWPPDGDTVMLGYNADQSAALAPEGQQGRRGFYLAIQHLNNNEGPVAMSDALSGNGVLGNELEGVDGDGQGQAEPSINNINRFIDQDGVQAFFGGISSTVTKAGMPIAQRKKVPYSGAISTSGGISGKDCTRYYWHKSGHSEFFGRAAGELLPEAIGEDQSMYHIYVDYSYGQSNRDAHNKWLADEGSWENLGGTPIAVGETDHSAQIADLQESGADVLIFTSFGGLARAGVKQMADAGILSDIEVIIPHMTGYTMGASGPEAQGVMGFAPWVRQFSDTNDFASEFVATFQSEFDNPATQSAAMAYTGVIQWAAMAEAAGTMHPPTVMKQVEDGWSWNNVMGPETYRKCDHTAERKMFLAESLAPENRDDTNYSLNLLEQTDPFIYPCDAFPASDCDIDSYDLE